MKKILLFMVAVLLVFGMVSCDQEVKAKTYKVTYNANGAIGNVPAAIEIEEGGTTIVPSCGSLSMKGYDFVGWNTKKDGRGSAYRESQSLKVDGDIILYAQWSIHEYSISYELDGGSYPEGRSNPKTYTIETENFTLNNPEKDGYEFLGWKTSEGEEPNKNVSIFKGTTGDLVFMAVWRPLKSYSISYDVNGGEGSIKTVLKLEGESVEIATASEVSRNGYGFVCWNTELDGTGKDYNPGDLYEEDADLQLYAKWSIIKYSIEYNLNDGKLATGKSNPVEYTVETSDIVLENPTKHGYEFVGWRYKDDSDASASTDFSIKKGTTGNLSIVAVWKALGTYTISYDANGGTGTIETQSEYKGTSLTISSSEGVERVGYIFSCWNTEKDGTGKDYKPNDTYSAGSDLRLYAQWNPVKYSIKYDLDGGAFSDGSSITEYTIETDTFTLPIPTKAEYEFMGWTTEKPDEAQKTFSIEKGSTGNLSFTAVWRKLNRYTVSYDVNGGSGSIESQLKLEGASMTVSDAVGIERDGYTFVCWNTKSDGTGEDYNPNDEYINDSDLVLYAKWSIVKYSITYDLTGGTLPEGKSNPSDYTIEDETFTLVSPEKEGYIFLGWKEPGSKDETAKENVSVAKGSNENKTFIAVWKQAKKFTVSFNANGADGGSAPTSLSVCEGDSFTVPSCGSLFKRGCAFFGWSAKSDGTGTRYLSSETVEIYGNVVLYAVWDALPLKYEYLSESDSYAVEFCFNASVVSIVIPSTYNGKAVSSIANSAFSGRSSLTSITIPDSVTSIGDFAFSRCSGLTSITIPESVTSIGVGAFSDCSGLESIDVSEGNTLYYSEGNCLIERDSKVLIFGCKNSVIPEDVVSIGPHAFYDCSGLESITIPESVTSIGKSVFAYCSGLTSITIPEGVTSIGDYAFYDCSGLESITIPEGVTSIGDYAFYDCSGLESITIPEGVTSIGDYAFYDCSGLESITIPESVTSIGKSVFAYCSGLTSITIPEGVTSIGDYAFSDCSGLENITIPESVTSVGCKSFYNCSGLSSVTLPCVENFDDEAFKGCKSVKTVILSGSEWTKRGMSFFFPDSFSSIETIKIVDSVAKIKGSLFGVCDSLKSIVANESNAIYYAEGNCLIEKASKNLILGCKGSVIPKGVTSIGDYAFYDCSGLESITIPESVTSIGDWAFYSCSGLTSITIPESVTSVGKNVFADCSGLTEIVLPDNSTSIGSGEFSGCSGLTEIVLPDNVTSIGGGAFSGCIGLTNIMIPENVTSIGPYTFSGCSGLTNIMIPENVTSIGSYAFSGCSGLTNIMIPENVTSIGSYAFSGCSGLTNVMIPEGVTNIGKGAFSGCIGLTRIEVPSSVLLIESSAFKDCYNLLEIAVPISSVSIYYQVFPVFENCSSIKKVILNGSNCVVELCKVFSHSYWTIETVTISNSVTNVGGGFIFRGCKNLKSVVVDSNNTVYYDSGNCVITKSSNELVLGCWNSLIPEGVLSIGDYAFKQCSYLTEILIPSSVTTIGKEAFRGCTGLSEIKIPSHVASIGLHAFHDCTNLSIVFAEGCTKIPKSALAEAEGVVSVSIPSGVTDIGDFAFSGCKGLTNTTIPDSVARIGRYAFSSCSSLIDIVYSGTIAQWNSIQKDDYWNSGTGNYTIHCSDGDIAKK